MGRIVVDGEAYSVKNAAGTPVCIRLADDDVTSSRCTRAYSHMASCQMTSSS